ncbi:MAG: histidine phosphatase family protein [archaeon]|nr:histidine phosphatase family protein [archaeon]
MAAHDESQRHLRAMEGLMRNKVAVASARLVQLVPMIGDAQGGCDLAGLAPVAADERTKRVIVIRHGQATHNAAAAASPHKCDCERDTPSGLCPYIDPALEDPGLTELGEAQAAQAAGFLAQAAIERVLVSPLRRTLQTARVALASSFAAAVPAVAIEDAREQFGQHTPDRRRDIGTAKEEFKLVDFSRIASGPDRHWTEARESKANLAERASNLIRTLFEFPEKRICLVSHSSLILTMLNVSLDVDTPAGASWFQPGECRIYDLTINL